MPQRHFTPTRAALFAALFFVLFGFVANANAAPRPAGALDAQTAQSETVVDALSLATAAEENGAGRYTSQIPGTQPLIAIGTATSYHESRLNVMYDFNGGNSTGISGNSPRTAPLIAYPGAMETDLYIGYNQYTFTASRAPKPLLGGALSRSEGRMAALGSLYYHFGYTVGNVGTTQRMAWRPGGALRELVGPRV